MSDLDAFPSLRAFGEQLDDLAERDAARRRGTALPPLLGVPRFVMRLALVACVVVGLVAVAYVAPPTRAAINDLYDNTLGQWISSGDSGVAPGRSAAAGEPLPDWLSSEQDMHGRGEIRVLAAAGGDRLIVLRQHDRVTLGVAGYSETASVSDLREELGDRALKFFAPGRFVADGRHDLRPIFGLASRAVASVRFEYSDGTPPVTVADVRGAFGLTIQTDHRPRSLSGFDRRGRLLIRLTFAPDARHARTRGAVIGDFRYCPGASGCQVWR